MNLKEVLSIVAVVLTLGLWAAYIWAVDRTVNVAISEHENELAELLVSRGADVNAVTLDGNDALRRAVELGKSSLAEILVKAGANVARVYPDGKTLLDVADKESSTYEYLIGCGAKERHANETE